MRTILGPFWDPSYFDLLLRKRGPKAPKRAEGTQKGRKGPQPSAGARRKGAERPELLVFYILTFLLEYVLEAEVILFVGFVS